MVRAINISHPALERSTAHYRVCPCVRCSESTAVLHVGTPQSASGSHPRYKKGNSSVLGSLADDFGMQCAYGCGLGSRVGGLSIHERNGTAQALDFYVEGFVFIFIVRGTICQMGQVCRVRKVYKGGCSEEWSCSKQASPSLLVQTTLLTHPTQRSTYPSQQSGI